MRPLVFPKAFDHLVLPDLEKMTTKVLYTDSGLLCGAVYDTLIEAAAMHNDLEDFVGPFADTHNGHLCMRFESFAVADMLSN